MTTKSSSKKDEGIQYFGNLGFDSDVHISDEELEEFKQRIIEGGIDSRNKLSEFVPLVDEFQAKVVYAQNETIRVVAPAGSGKTQTVINRAIERIKEGINAKRILILTFDNSAAGSINSKLEILKNELAVAFDPPEIRTLNSFGYRVLREFVPNEYKSIPSPAIKRKAIVEIKKNLQEISSERFVLLPKNITNNYYIEFFSLLKNQLFDPRNFIRKNLIEFILSREESFLFFEDPVDKNKMRLVIDALIWLFQAQEICYGKAKVLDFDDQKLRAYISIVGDPSLKATIQNMYSEIIVDEFQDINKLDFEFIKVISQGANLIVVGDDDQAIYGFRGSTAEYIINLEKHLGRKVTSYELSMNYRCPKNIVTFANKLIQHNNPNRIKKSPIPVIDQDAKLKIVPSTSPIDEAKKIVRFIDAVRYSKHLERDEIFGFENFAVLYRANAQSFPLQLEFIKNNIPYHVRDKDNVLNNKVLENILSILEVKQDIQHKRASSVENAIAVLDSFFKYISPQDLSMLKVYFSEKDDFRSLISLTEFRRIFPKAQSSNFGAVIRELVMAKNLDDSLEVISNRFNAIYGLVGGLEDVVNDRVPLGEIFDIASTYKGDILEFIRSIKDILKTALSGKAGKNEENGVSLRTYFKAKGLQWDTVILMTCNEGIIPHKRAKIQDERRLFYVAITRVSSNLYISYVKNVSKNSVMPSSFLTEAGFL